MPKWNHNENIGEYCKAKHRKPCDSEFGVQSVQDAEKALLVSDS